MTVLDSQAVIAMLIGEPAAAEVETLLRARPGPPAIAAVNVGEVVDVLVRLKGRTLDEVTERLDWLVAGGLKVTEVTDAIGRDAGGSTRSDTTAPTDPFRSPTAWPWPRLGRRARRLRPPIFRSPRLLAPRVAK